jgi:hypothetical protein
MADYYNYDEADIINMIDLSPYDVNNNKPLVYIQNTGTENDDRTMTPAEIKASEASGTANSNSIIGNVLDSTLNTVTSGMTAVQNAITGVKDGTFSVTEFITDNAKTLRNVAILAGVCVASYYALNIIANTKRNLKTLKA